MLDEAGIRFPFCSDLNLAFREAQLRISARGPTRRFERGRRNARNRRILVIAGRSGEGLLTEPTTAAQPWQREPLLMPLSGHCPSARSTASLGGYLLLAPGVSTVRLSDPSTDLQVRCHGSERNGREVRNSDFARIRLPLENNLRVHWNRQS